MIDIGARSPLTTRYKRRAVAEELVHILEIEPLGLWLKTPKEDGVRQITHDEHKVEFLTVLSQSSRI